MFRFFASLREFFALFAVATGFQDERESKRKEGKGHAKRRREELTSEKIIDDF